MHETFLRVDLVLQNVVELFLECETIYDLAVLVQNCSSLFLWAQNFPTFKALQEDFSWGQFLRVHVLQPTLLSLNLVLDLKELGMVRICLSLRVPVNIHAEGLAFQLLHVLKLILVTIRRFTFLFLPWLLEHGDILIELVLLQVFDLIFVEETPFIRLLLIHLSSDIDVALFRLAFEDLRHLFCVLEDYLARLGALGLHRRPGLACLEVVLYHDFVNLALRILRHQLSNQSIFTLVSVGSLPAFNGH